jgi:dTDP-4-amino-4,6-dideoxygalactose transaminase
MRAARIGFRTILENLNFGPSDTILLPAYIGITDREGSGVMDPVTAVQANIEFYPVDQRLSGNLDFIRNRLTEGGIKAILIIHYFGIAQNDMEALRTICDQYGIIMIEDCAHAWCSSLNGIPLGEYGEYSFGSIHKYLAAGDGGFVKWHEGFLLESTLLPEEAISRESLIDFTSADYPAIADIRLKSYRYLAARLTPLEGIEIMYPELAPGIIPLNFPILVTGMPREKLYFELIDRGYTLIALYYRLIPEIDKDQFPTSYKLSENILNLPVHQDTTIDDLDGLVEAMKDILEQWRKN